MLQEINHLFGGRRPSVKTFMTLLESYSPREREKWLLTAFRAGAQEWKQANPTYRKFLKI